MISITKKKGLIITCAVLMYSISSLPAQDLKSAIRLTRCEQFSAATSVFKTLLNQSPANGDLYYYFGENMIAEYSSDTSNYSLREISDSAKNIFNLGTQKDPANPLNLVGLGEVALLNKNIQKAQEYYAKASALLPSKSNKGLVMDPLKHSTVLVRMANGYIRALIRDTGQIFSLLRAAEKIDPKNYELYIVKGDAYIFLLNDGSNAISNYNIAQTLNPQSPFAKLRIGQLWMRAKKYKDALTYYDEAIKIDSNFAPAYKERGFLLSKANRNEEAKRDFAKFLKLSANNTTARVQYVNVLFDIQDYKEAVIQLNEVLKVDSSNNDLNRALAYAYFETSQYDKALFYMKKFFAGEKPDKIRSADYVYFGRILAKNKMDEQAYAALLTGYKLDTTKPELLSEAAVCLSKTKKYDMAIDIYKKKIAIKAVPMDYYNIGKCYYSVEDYKKADSNLTIFHEKAPDYIAALSWMARTKVHLDTTSKEGLAKPVYEELIAKTQSDTVKYCKERLECFSYLSSYYYVQYAATKNKDYAVQAIAYSNRVLALNPKEEKEIEKASMIIKALKMFVN